MHAIPAVEDAAADQIAGLVFGAGEQTPTDQGSTFDDPQAESTDHGEDQTERPA